MNFYPHHIGDFNNATRHLSRTERSIYRDMIEMYYDTEQPLPLDSKVLCRKLMARTEDEATAVEQVLNEFFTKTVQGWHHARCEQEISEYHANISAKSAAGKASAAKREEMRLKRLNDLNSEPTPVQHTLKSVGSSVQLTSNQEPEPITTTTSSVASATSLACPTQKIIDAYHELMPANPKMKVLNDARKRMIKARWQEAATLHCKPFGYSTVDEGMNAWGDFFAICAESKFLTGLVPGQPGKPPFIADIDFLLSPQGFAKILENKYHRDAA